MWNSDIETADPPLGMCPVCDVSIPAANLVVAYDRAGDWPRMLATCPDCADAVNPV